MEVVHGTNHSEQLSCVYHNNDCVCVHVCFCFVAGSGATLFLKTWNSIMVCVAIFVSRITCVWPSMPHTHAQRCCSIVLFLLTWYLKFCFFSISGYKERLLTQHIRREIFQVWPGPFFLIFQVGPGNEADIMPHLRERGLEVLCPTLSHGLGTRLSVYTHSDYSYARSFNGSCVRDPAIILRNSCATPGTTTYSGFSLFCC